MTVGLGGGLAVGPRGELAGASGREEAGPEEAGPEEAGPEEAGPEEAGGFQGFGLGAEPAGGRASGRIPGQRRGYQRHERRRDTLEIDLAGNDAVEDRLVRAAAERHPAGRRERHRRAPAVHVGRGGAWGALDHLGREVAGGAHDQPGLGQPGRVARLGDAEVDHDRPIVGEHHVTRLQVPVHHARRVDRGQCLRRPVGEPAQARAGHRAAAAQHLLQRGPGHELRDDIGILPGHVGVEDLGHVRAADPPHGLHLAGQAAAGVRALLAELVQHLDRDQAPLRVTGEVDHPHAACPEAVLKAIRAESPRQSFGRRHCVIQCTKRMPTWGALKMLPIGNGGP